MPELAYHRGVAQRFLILPFVLLLCSGPAQKSGGPDPKPEGPTVPRIEGRVELRPSKDVGPFTTGPDARAFSVGPKERKQLESLAKRYEQVARKNFSLIIERLGHASSVPREVSIVVTDGYKGIAATSGNRILVSAEYALRRPEDLGMIVHEMAHVVQAYPAYDPGWLVEGIADYVRWFYYEPNEKRPKPNPEKAGARDSYQTTAAFLYWAANKYDSGLVPKLHAALRSKSYREDLFKDLTGRTLDELNLEWRDSLKRAEGPVRTGLAARPDVVHFD